MDNFDKLEITIEHVCVVVVMLVLLPFTILFFGLFLYSNIRDNYRMDKLKRGCKS